ncbi:MAG TPA: PQQ-dependent sugar dehydrogenase, partial [Vicinamibacterales bacterium]|nr:PQQ-dependent sugar dehydrogenase [Vicinamibacterales bacterium]
GQDGQDGRDGSEGHEGRGRQDGHKGMTGKALRVLACAVCVTIGIADLRAQLRARVQASGFTVPLGFVQDPTDRATQFVVQQDGHIRVLRGASVLSRDFLDLSGAIVSGGEQGLLGLAFPPNTAASRRLFVNFTNRSGDTVVARFRRSDDAAVADPMSRFDLRWGSASGPAFIAQPFANHNGGNLVFGPDGYLYIGLGDGGAGGDPGNRAQNPAELLGKMLRIDVGVDDGDPIGYQVPADNPFARGVPIAARPEVWSFGLRNPWRYSFDDPVRGGTGAMVIGDVGQDRYEEVDYEPRDRGGRNYGWRLREGAHDYDVSQPPAFAPLVEPIHEYDHRAGVSITGGYVYRGSALPATFRGRYFFADLTGRVWSLGLIVDPVSGEARSADVVEHTAELSVASGLGDISSFGIDGDGELYIVDYSNGRILKIVGPPAAPATPTGLRIVK